MTSDMTSDMTYITEIATDNCIMMYFHCVKNKKAAPEIKMDAANTCETASTVPPTTASPSCKCGVKRTARIVGGTETEVIMSSHNSILHQYMFARLMNILGWHY